MPEELQCKEQTFSHYVNMDVKRGQVLDSALTVSEFLSQSVANGVGDYGQGHLVGVSRLGWLSWSGWIFHC